MKHIKTISILFCSLFLLCGCNGTQEVLKVGENSISKKDFHIIYRNQIRDLYIDEQNKKLLTRTQIRQKVAQNIVDSTLEYDVLTSIPTTKEEIDALYKKYLKLAGSEEKLKEKNKESGMDDKIFLDFLKRKVQIKKLIVKNNLYKITESEIKKYYKDHETQYTTPEQYEVFHILLRTNYAEIKNRYMGNNKEHKIKLEELDNLIHEEIKKNNETLDKIKEEITIANFTQLDQKYSQDEKTIPTGGYMGFIEANDVTPSFLTQIQLQEPGTISPVTKTKDGSHLIYLRKVVPRTTIPLSVLRDDIELLVYDEKEAELLQKCLDKIRRTTVVKYTDKTLNPTYESLPDKISKIFKRNKKVKNGKNNQ